MLSETAAAPLSKGQASRGRALPHFRFPAQTAPAMVRDQGLGASCVLSAEAVGLGEMLLAARACGRRLPWDEGARGGWRGKGWGEGRGEEEGASWEAL